MGRAEARYSIYLTPAVLGTSWCSVSPTRWVPASAASQPHTACGVNRIVCLRHTKKACRNSAGWWGTWRTRTAVPGFADRSLTTRARYPLRLQRYDFLANRNIISKNFFKLSSVPTISTSSRLSGQRRVRHNIHKRVSSLYDVNESLHMLP